MRKCQHDPALYLQQIKCPYYQEALAIQAGHTWHELEEERKEPAVYYDMEGIWHYCWIDIDSALRPIIKQAHALQVELEMQNKAHAAPPSQDPVEPPTPSKPAASADTHIQHVEVMYSHCTFNYGTAPQAPAKEEKAPSDTPAPAPAYPSFYRTNAQSITTIEKHLQIALSFATKTKCIRYLLEHSHKDGCFNFSAMTYSERAEALNQVQDKHHFTAGDFENAAHKIQRP